MTRNYIVVIFWLFCATSIQANPGNTAGQLHETRTLGSSFISELMLHFNPVEAPMQQIPADIYKGQLQQLHQHVEQSGVSAAISELTRLDEAVAKLEGMPQESGNSGAAILPYPRAVTDVFKSYQRLDQALARQYDSIMVELDETTLKRQKLSMSVSRMMMLYSLSTYPSLSYLNEIDPTLAKLDQDILEQFQALKAQLPESATELDKLQVTYRFVQPRLVDLPRPWSPGGVVLYLGRIIQKLEELK